MNSNLYVLLGDMVIKNSIKGIESELLEPALLLSQVYSYGGYSIGILKKNSTHRTLARFQKSTRGVSVAHETDQSSFF